MSQPVHNESVIPMAEPVEDLSPAVIIISMVDGLNLLSPYTIDRIMTDRVKSSFGTIITMTQSLWEKSNIPRHYFNDSAVIMKGNRRNKLWQHEPRFSLFLGIPFHYESYQCLRY